MIMEQQNNPKNAVTAKSIINNVRFVLDGALNRKSLFGTTIFNHATMNSAFRFSKNALVPSLKSGVPKHLPNSSISRCMPLAPGS